MKIIDIAICIDNNDPKHLGRIRCIRDSSYTGEVERAFTYNAWDDKDLFTANPFLPTNINFIPEIGQTVKIINYNTTKETTNVEYIAGPFTTMHDYNSQTHSAQIENTTYGIFAKHGTDVINKSGKFKNPKSEGSFAKHTDYAVYGKYGSDVLFTNNGVQLRGGKLLSKESATTNQKTTMVTQPLMSEKSSILYLKKFAKKLELKNETVVTDTLVVSNLKSFVEYSVDNFSGGTANVNIYVYLVVGTVGGDTYRTNNPTLVNSPLLDGKVELISNNPSSNVPTLTIPVTDLDGVITTIRNVIKTITTDGNLSSYHVLNPLPHSKENLFPFYFRPTEESKTRNIFSQELTNRIKVFSSIKPYTNVGPQSGLIFSKESIQPPTIPVTTVKQILKESTDNVEQTFSALKSDKIYLLSTDLKTNRINFNTLDKYDLTQENYLTDIEGSTYSTVRGEELLEFLREVYYTLVDHTHNINEPYARAGFDHHKRMEELFTTLESRILNGSIRIN